jgi:imidazole glycerol-phosphate synthase subunit HisH
MQVTVVDYGIGNLYSVGRALEYCGAEVFVTGEADAVERATHLVLPGVGAFADGMQGLRERGLVEPIRRYATSGRPLLGICLGMQMLAGLSEEFGEHEGLGLIPGRVLPVPARDPEGRPLKIPHVGWSALKQPIADRWDGSVLAGTPQGTAMYLVHSFHLVPQDTADLLAVCRYGGHDITAAVQRGNVVGVQFHPEKSATAGMHLLTRWMTPVTRPR